MLWNRPKGVDTFEIRAERRIDERLRTLGLYAPRRDPLRFSLPRDSGSQDQGSSRIAVAVRLSEIR
jgi:hypothetical protein